jgi:hypothetical protein
MFKISHTEPSLYNYITYWAHMEEMKWFSSGFLGVLAAKSVGFGLIWLESDRPSDSAMRA